MKKTESIHPPALQSSGLNRGFWWTSLALVVLFAIMLPLDLMIEASANIDGWPGDLKRIFQLLEIFGHGTGLAVVFVGLIVLKPDLTRSAIRMLVAFAFAGILVNSIKLFVFRYRPSQYRIDRDGMFQSWLGVLSGPDSDKGWVWNSEYITQSFPSGHSANVMVLAMSMTLMFPRGRFFFLILGVLACFQRIVAHAHWPSDIVAGAFCGWVAFECVRITGWRQGNSAV